mgnify:CR=1 FL=1
MRLADSQKSKIGIKILLAMGFFVIFVVFVSADDYPIKISDSLTLHNGDLITLRADDNTYLKRSGASWSYPRGSRDCVTLTGGVDPDQYSEFIVETVGNNTIRLLAKDTQRYLTVYHYIYKGGTYPKDSWDWIGLNRQFIRPLILIYGTNPQEASLFRVKVMSEFGNKIALQAFGNPILSHAYGKYLARFNTKIPPGTGLGGGPILNIITVEVGEPVDEYDYSVFTVTRTGIAPGYVQSVSNVTFDLKNLKLSTKPSVIIQFEPQENTGKTERHFTIDDEYTTRKTNKWIWEKGVELVAGTKITANLEKSISAEIPGTPFGASQTLGFGAEISTEITKSTKETSEWAEEEQHTVRWSQFIPIPPKTRVSAELIATQATVDVPFTATVNVAMDNTSESYSYPINGTYHGTRFINVKVNITEEPLQGQEMPTSPIYLGLPQLDSTEIVDMTAAVVVNENNATSINTTSIETTNLAIMPAVATQNNTTDVASTSENRSTTYATPGTAVAIHTALRFPQVQEPTA